MERDIADIKRVIERLTNSVERIVNQTDQLEDELRQIRILLEKMDQREEKRYQDAQNEKKW